MEKQFALKKVQLKLTIIFTLLVFLIAGILQVSFFSYKYLSGIQKETNRLNFLSKIIIEKNIPLNKLTTLIKNQRQLGDSKKYDSTIDMPGKGKIMNFAILDSYNNVLIENIRGEIDINAVNKIINNQELNVKVEGGTIIKYSPIHRTIETYQLLLFKQLDYDFETYVSDIIRFFIAIALFSILFLFIGYIFVKRNLKPVEDNIIEMNDFVHNAGHELKTPISVINSNLQLMKQFGEYKEEMINENLNEINRLNNLIEALVTITDIQDNQKFIKNQIKPEINYILEEYKSIITEKKINIKHKQSKDFCILADKEYLYILLSNIIKNAIKFSNNGGSINISYMDNKCIIQDFGVGIDKNNIVNIFNRFFQEEQSRNTEGFGIGLALVSKIANIYKWSLNIDSVKGEGTKFTINFK